MANWKKYICNNVAKKGLYLEYIKNYKSVRKNKTKQTKLDHLLHIQMINKHIKKITHHYLLEKCKLKSQCRTNAHLPEWEKNPQQGLTISKVGKSV